MTSSLGLMVALAGCVGETSVRLNIQPSASARPVTALRLSLFGAGRIGAPRTISPVTLPGTLVLHAINPTTPDFRVQVDAFAGDKLISAQAASGIPLLANGAATVELPLGIGLMPDQDSDGVPDAIDDCPTIPDPDQTGCAGVDLGHAAGNLDLAHADLSPPTSDLAAPPDLANGSSPDLGGVMQANVCPSFALFCDDFESGNLSKWSVEVIQPSGGSVVVDTQQARHGTHAQHSIANAPVNEALAYSEYDFASLAPPIALRFNVYPATPLSSTSNVVQLYNNAGKGFAIAADSNGHWMIQEDQSGVVYRSNVAIAINSWTCIELVVQANGQVQLFLNGAASPQISFARMSAVGYQLVTAGSDHIGNSGSLEVWIDDFALATQRLYCP